MIDIDDSETLVALFKRAEHLAMASDARIERELAAIHKRTMTLFIGRGESDIDAFFRADDLTRRIRAMVETHRRRMGRAS